MNHRNISSDILSRRVENLVDRYEMRRTGKSLFAVRHERIKRENRIKKHKLK